MKYMEIEFLGHFYRNRYFLHIYIYIYGALLIGKNIGSVILKGNVHVIIFGSAVQLSDWIILRFGLAYGYPAHVTIRRTK